MRLRLFKNTSAGQGLPICHGLEDGAQVSDVGFGVWGLGFGG